MTIEEIEARWKAATPGPWAFDAGRGGIASGVIDVINTDDGFVSISDEDAKAIAAAPTDIAYLLDRVRKLERAHAWFVDRWFVDRCDSTDEAGCSVCGGDTGHKDGCEWVKAKELRL